MAETIVIIAGLDRAGLLDDIVQPMLSHQLTIAEIRECMLNGAFGMVMQLRGDDAAISKLHESLPALSKQVGVHMQAISASAPRPGSTHHHAYDLRVSAPVQAAILKKISNLLRVLKINIEEIEGHRADTDMLSIHLQLSVPRELPLTQLKELLGQLLLDPGTVWELAPR